jgi:hypothetical protein
VRTLAARTGFLVHALRQIAAASAGNRASYQLSFRPAAVYVREQLQGAATIRSEILMAMIRVPVMRAACVLGSALLTLTACDKIAGGDDSDFARAALERNDQLSIMAYDKNAKTFTVKVRDTGEIQVVRADEVIGTVPAAEKSATAKAAAAPPPPPPQATAEPADTATAAAGEEARPAPGSEKPPAANDAATARAPTGTGFIKDSSGKVTTFGGAESGAASATPSSSAATERGTSDGKTLASGPGYSIKASGAPPAAIRLASSSPSIPSPARGVALERRYEPMICQGQRLLHIDGRNLEFEGDGISAENGCEIHITNSHIIAHGVGVSARAANVHIKNSVIEGDSGSVSASEDAQVYTQSSTFKGLSRRLDTATFHDLGNTNWVD